jgi:hypothetical protein
MSTPSAPAAGALSIGEYLISARSFEEYQAMFALADGDLTEGVLDCPGGGAGFTAAARGRGIEAVAVDPVYAMPADRLVSRTTADLDRGSRFAAENAQRYVWNFYGDAAGHAQLRARSAARFAEDLLAHPGRYVAAALPSLPFAEGSVGLVLSSHLLFTYADRLDRDFHLAALLELVRVSRGRVRVYPLVDQAGGELPELVDWLLGRLNASGVHAVVREVDYEFQRGARNMLELRRAG